VIFRPSQNEQIGVRCVGQMWRDRDDKELHPHTNYYVTPDSSAAFGNHEPGADSGVSGRERRVRFAGQRRDEIYAWTERTLVRHQYSGLSRPEKGLLRQDVAQNQAMREYAARRGWTIALQQAVLGRDDFLWLHSCDLSSPALWGCDRCGSAPASYSSRRSGPVSG
jgi:hypothetical protein